MAAVSSISAIATISATTTAAFARSHRTSLIYDQGPAHQILAVASLHGARRRAIVIDFDKPEPPSLSCEAVSHDRHRIDCNPLICKEILQIRLIGSRRGAHENFFTEAPNCNWRKAERYPRADTTKRLESIRLSNTAVVCQKGGIESKKKIRR